MPQRSQEDPFIRKLPRRLRPTGFTLIELMIALAILAVVVLIGWSSFRDSLPRYRMVSTAKAFRGDLMNVRNLAIQTGRETRLRLTDSPGDCSSDREVWGGSWEMAIGDRSSRSSSWDLLPGDSLDDGSDDDSSEAFVDIGDGGNQEARWVCLAQWGEFDGPGSDNVDSVVFSPRGWVLNPGGDFSSNGYIEVTFVNQIAGADGVTDEITIQISRAGMVRMTPTLSNADPGTAGTTTTSSQ